MTFTGIILGTLCVVIVAAAGFVVFGLGSGEQADVVRNERGVRSASFRHTTVRRLNESFVRSRLGERIASALTQANLRRIYAIEYAAIALLTALFVMVMLFNVIAIFYTIVIALLIVWGFWGLLSVLRERQREKFIQQLPEFARLMANSTGAGLAVQSALRIAAAELPDPAGRELEILERELAIGTPLDTALERMSARIKGRDLDVLVSTLVISQRSGGSLITALRGMSETLEARKETKREVKTIVTQSSFTGYMVILFGLGFILIMNAMSHDLLYKLTSTFVGQAGLIFAGICYAIGVIAISKLTKVKL